MKKSFIAIGAALTLGLSGCASTTATPPTNNESTATEQASEAKMTPNLSGAWKQSNSPSETEYQAAVIKGDTITINWVSNNGDTKSLYWVGTFKAPTTPELPFTWTSERDKKATESAILASTSDTKEFTFENDEITYEAGIMGTTTTVRLTKSK